MNPVAGDQLSLLTQPDPDPKQEQMKRAKFTGLGLLISQRAWLQFLGSEWLVPRESGQFLLGVNCLNSEGIDAIESSIAVWFDIAELPSVPIHAYSDGKWFPSELGTLNEAHCALAWNGPLPLFAVDHFGVATDELRRHLIALSQGFRDIAPLEQPVLVETQIELRKIERVEQPMPAGTTSPPVNWNSLRGAASMAVWAVPTIDPWLNLLCEALQDSQPNELAEGVHANWWRSAIWACNSNSLSDDPLWTAILHELGAVQGPRQLRPRGVLDNICMRATEYGASKERVSRLQDVTHRLLDDQTTIQKAGVVDDVLGLSLQLLLLRPSLDRFVGWREDWPAMPPGAWWTGATLCGFLTGFNGLPTEFRGTTNARRLLALRTWKLSCGGDAGPFSAVASETLDWTRIGNAILLRADGKAWAEHKISRRGRWYQLNFEDRLVYESVQSFAREAQPNLITAHLVLKAGRVPFSSKSGKCSVRVEANGKGLVIDDEVEIELENGSFIEQRFSVARFKDWLTTASISDALPRPVFGQEPNAQAPQVGTGVSAELPGFEDARAKPDTRSTPNTSLKSKSRVRKTVITTQSEAPLGLSLRMDFINEDEERDLLANIDKEVWDDSMTRRVQHYGWKYDYKARKVDPSLRIGPLPNWLQTLATRLMEKGIFNEMPDQVIVNNYTGTQSISKHVDCVSCFRGPIVTISLNEAWEMLFAPKSAASDFAKFGQILPRRSAAVLDGDVRLNWTHEIPRRKKEGEVVRERRVSVTFRKVNL